MSAIESLQAKIDLLLPTVLGAAFAGGVTNAARAIEPLDESQQLLVELRNAVELNAGVKRVDGLPDTSRVQHEIDSAIAMIDRIGDPSNCGELPVVYVECLDGHFDTSVYLHIAAVGDHEFFWFTSGTSIDIAVQAINYNLENSLRATVSPQNQSRIALRATYPFENAFVMVEQLTGQSPVVASDAVGGSLVFQLIDYACAVNEPLCAEPGKIYFETGSVFSDAGGYVLLEVGSHFGSSVLNIQSGRTQAQIIDQINNHEVFNTAAWAQQSMENPDRIEIRSRFVGRHSFVWAVQYNGVPHRLYRWPDQTWGYYDVYDLGQGGLNGDANCDRAVGVTDLLMVLQGWGECQPHPLICTGDVTGDGVVNVSDLLNVINNWGAAE